MTLVKPKVLVIDDEPHLVNLVRLVLEDEFEVFDAYTGIEGVSIANTVHPDLILLDTQMPGMDGYQTAMHLRKLARTRNIPVMMMVARNKMADKFRIVRAGADDAIVKPFEPNDLRRRVKLVINRLGVVI